MNDLDLLRTMRADAPEPAGHRLAAGRDRLRSAAAPRRHRRRGYVVILAGGLAAASAAAVIVASQPSPAGAPRGPADIRLVSAAQVLNRAAAAAAARPAVLPSPHQWIYSKGIKSGPGGSGRFVMARFPKGFAVAFIKANKGRAIG